MDWNDLTEQQKEYFHHWKYTGNTLQRRLKVGPKKPVYTTISEREAQIIAKAPENEIEMMPDVLVTQEGKTLRWNSWWADFVENQGKFTGASLLKQSPWAIRCVEIRSRGLASIPWGIYRGDKELLDDEYTKLLTEVNEEVNWFDFIAATEADLLVYSQAFWLKLGEGKVKFLQRLNPHSMEVKVDATGIVGFKQTLSGGDKSYSRKQVVYFHTYDPLSDFTGISPLEVVREPIETEVEANLHLKEFFRNRAMPDYIMSLKTNNPEELRRISEAWNRDFKGEGKRHKTGWVGGEAKVNEVGYAPEELALAEVRAEARRQICAGFGVPPAIVGAWEAANYATIREQRQSLYMETIIPRAEYIRGVIDAELGSHFGGKKFRWKYDLIPAMQETEDDKAKRSVWLVDAGIIKPEVAAVALGYGEGDVPEQPRAPNPTDNNNNVGRPPSMPGPSDQRLDDKKTEAALRKWRRKSINRVKAGKAADCPFTSAYISDTLHNAITEDLGEAKSADEVHQVFEDAGLDG